MGFISSGLSVDDALPPSCTCFFELPLYSSNLATGSQPLHSMISSATHPAEMTGTGPVPGSARGSSSNDNDSASTSQYPMDESAPRYSLYMPKRRPSANRGEAELQDSLNTSSSKSHGAEHGNGTGAVKRQSSGFLTLQPTRHDEDWNDRQQWQLLLARTPKGQSQSRHSSVSTTRLLRREESIRSIISKRNILFFYCPFSAR